MHGLTKQKYEELRAISYEEKHAMGLSRCSDNINRFESILGRISSITRRGEQRALESEYEVLLTDSELNKLKNNYVELNKIIEKLKHDLNLQYDSILEINKELIDSIEECLVPYEIKNEINRYKSIKRS